MHKLTCITLQTQHWFFIKYFKIEKQGQVYLTGSATLRSCYKSMHGFVILTESLQEKQKRPNT